MALGKSVSSIAEHPNFFQFIWNSRTNQLFLFVWLGSSIALWWVFKIFYPFPNFILDSCYYIRAAFLGLQVNAWPIGYSKFIWFCRLFSGSVNLVVTLQYVLLQFSFLALFFSWRYLFEVGKIVSWVLFFSLLVNPLFFFCCNYILTEGIYVALSLLWLTILLWIIYKPGWILIILHTLVLTLAFTIRYNAVYYPFISAIAFILSSQSLVRKLTGIVLPMMFIAGFVYYTGGCVAKVTGRSNFSPFGGWKLANNALYMYAHLYKDYKDPVPIQFQGIDSVVRAYFISSQDPGFLREEDQTYGSPYMFDLDSPLILYMDQLYGKSDSTYNSKKWMKIATLYQSYGGYLTRKYPFEFMHYFVWPNCYRYFFPPAENYGCFYGFNLYVSHGSTFVTKMYGLRQIHFDQSAIDFDMAIFNLYPYLIPIFHIGFILVFIGFLWFKGIKCVKTAFGKMIGLVMLVWLIDSCFYLFTSGIVLRYEVFILIIETYFGLFFTYSIYSSLDRKEVERKSKISFV
jgi:hypothetical protein